MRETYSTLLQTSKDFCVDSSSTSTTSLSNTQSFLATQINSTIQYLHSLIKNYKSQPLPRTFTTVASQIYYHWPSDLIVPESVTVTIGNITYPLQVVNSQEFWNELQSVSVVSATIPQYYFPRRDDFGIYPTPASAQTVTVVGNYLPQRISIDDYSAGTIAIPQNSRTVTGTSTVFTAAMVGRWLVETDATSGLPVGKWYKIGSYTSSTSITLETYYEESTLSGSTYIIGQSPEIPEELHEYIPYRSASVYYSTIRRDANRAQELLNFFYTGDFSNSHRGGGIKGGVLGVINEYKNKGRANSQTAHINKNKNQLLWPFRDERWTTTLT